MITAMVRTALLFTQMADGMMFHVHGTLDPFVKLVSMLVPLESDDQIAQCPRGCSVNKNLFQNCVFVNMKL